MAHKDRVVIEGTEGLETTRFGCHLMLALKRSKDYQNANNSRYQLSDFSLASSFKEVYFIGPETRFLPLG